jgi:hypothetical protein
VRPCLREKTRGAERREEERTGEERGGKGRRGGKEEQARGHD